MDNVVKTTCFLTDMKDFAAFNEVYAKHFPGKPARSCFAVKDLPAAHSAKSKSLPLNEAYAMDFHTLCIGCRTYRRFKQKQIPEEILDELLENARIANSAMNGQPLRYVLVKTPEAVRKIQSCFHFAAALPKELGQPKEGEQPTALSFSARKDGKPRGQA